jgi:hypothetical protein
VPKIEGAIVLDGAATVAGTALTVAVDAERATVEPPAFVAVMTT